MSKRAVLMLCSAAALGAVAWRLADSPAAAPTHGERAFGSQKANVGVGVTPRTARPATVDGESRRESRTTEPTKQATKTTNPAKTMLLPDGTRVPTLNGATNVKSLADVWPRNRPWSPIVGKMQNDFGVEWYVHADGTRTTTEMRWRADLGREDALTRIAEPGPAAPPEAAPPGK